MDLLAAARQVRLLAMDIDGTLTDGSIWIGPQGECAKRFSVRDGFGIKLLQKAGIIKLKDPTNILSTSRDLAENPKKLRFRELDAAFLPRALDDADLALINTNYALAAGLQPNKDALVLEGADSPYANIVTARPDNAKSPAIAKLMKALRSPETKKFIEEKYKGAIIPAF